VYLYPQVCTWLTIWITSVGCWKAGHHWVSLTEFHSVETPILGDRWSWNDQLCRRRSPPTAGHQTSLLLPSSLQAPGNSFTLSYLHKQVAVVIYTNTHTHLTALCLGLYGWASTRKVKPIWILLKQETVSGRGISWAICKSAPRSRQITMPALNHSVFYRPDWMPFLPPNQQCQSTEGCRNLYYY